LTSARLKELLDTLVGKPEEFGGIPTAEPEVRESFHSSHCFLLGFRAGTLRLPSGTGHGLRHGAERCGELVTNEKRLWFTVEPERQPALRR
jgi:hypothetical protein